MNTKGQINLNIVIVGDFSTSYSCLHKPSKVNIKRGNSELNYTTEQIDFIDTYRRFHLKEIKRTLFLAFHGIYSKTDYVLGHKSSLTKCKNSK